MCVHAGKGIITRGACIAPNYLPCSSVSEPGAGISSRILPLGPTSICQAITPTSSTAFKIVAQANTKLSKYKPNEEEDIPEFNGTLQLGELVLPGE